MSEKKIGVVNVYYKFADGSQVIGRIYYDKITGYVDHGYVALLVMKPKKMRKAGLNKDRAHGFHIHVYGRVKKHVRISETVKLEDYLDLLEKQVNVWAKKRRTKIVEREISVS